MRLKVLTESATLGESPFDIKVQFNINSGKYSLNPEFNSEISKEFIRGLNVDKVKDAVSLTRPYISAFFSAVLGRDYGTVLDTIYPVAAMFVGKFSNSSPIMDEFKTALSISDTYFDTVNKFLEFYRGIESDSSIVLRKVQAIYDRFKDNRAKVLDGLFNVYEEYLSTLKGGEETGKSKSVKQKLYSEYVKNQNLIEDVLDEVASLSPNKTEDSPLKSIEGKNYDAIRNFFEENRGDMRKISAKLLYLAYFDEILSNEQGKLYSTSSYPKFTGKKDKNSLTSEVKEAIAAEFGGDFLVGVNNTGFSVTISNISSVDFQKVAESIITLGQSGSMKLTFLEMYREIKDLPQYSFYYAYDEVFGTKNLIENAAKLLDIESVKNVASILANQPMPEDFELGKYSFEVEGNSVVSSQISTRDIEKAMKYIKLFAILKDFNLSDYEDEIKSIVKRLANNPDASFPIDDVLRSVRKSKGGTFSVMAYNSIKGSIRNPETYNDIAEVLSYVAYHSAIDGSETNKLFQQLFRKILISSQTEIIDSMIRKTKGDEIKLDKVKEFLLDYRRVLSSESLTRLGVTDNVE